MIWMTADHHFGHANLIRLVGRPFASVGDMDDFLVKRWNERVGPGDVVYHLGDFALGGPKMAERYFSALNGAVRLVPGGHDRRWLMGADGLRWKVEVLPPLVTLEFPKLGSGKRPQVVVLCHYAMRTWDRSHHGSWMLYGHSHGKLPGLGRSLDVGVDCNGFAPFSLDEVAGRMAAWR